MAACNASVPRLAAPFMATWKGIDFDAATNGLVLVLLRGPCVYAPRDVAPPVDRVMDATMEKPPDGELFTGYDVLLDWAFAGIRCVSCGGVGSRPVMAIGDEGDPWEASDRCGRCDGTGFGIAPGRFANSNTVFNRRQLYVALSALPPVASVQVNWWNQPEHAILLRGGVDRWLAIVMPLKSVDEDRVSTYEHHETSVGVPLSELEL